MASFVLTDVDVYAGALDASAFGSSVAVDAGIDLVKRTTFASGGWDEYVAANRGFTLVTQGPQDLAATAAGSAYGPDEYYALNLGTAYPVSIVPSGAAVGSVAYISEARLAGYTPLQGDTASLAEQSSKWVQTRYPLARGKLMAIANQGSGTLTGTATQLGAVSATQSIYATLHLLTAEGAPSVTVTLESDDNSGFTTPTTRATFTVATTRTAELKVTAGAITDDWWRFKAVVSGTTPQFQIRCCAAIQ